MSSQAQECDSKRLECVQTYRPRLAAGGSGSSSKVRLYHVVLLALYVHQLVWVIGSMGEPYETFLKKAHKEGWTILQGTTKLRAQMEHSLQDLNDPNRRVGKLGWFDWMELDIEELAEEQRKDRLDKKGGGATAVDMTLPAHMRVPSPYAPSFVPTLLLGILVCLHALLLLMQVWSVRVLVYLQYQPADAPEQDDPWYTDLIEEHIQVEQESQHETHQNTNTPGQDHSERLLLKYTVQNIPSHLPTHVRVTPAKGKDMLLPIQYIRSLGMTFEYHRRRYVYHNQMWCKIRCPTKFQTQQLNGWNGLEHIAERQLKYGPNQFAVAQPQFGELYRKQLQSPFTVFQLFCVILWMLEEYWQYSAFTLGMILVFEATVVFSRLKSIQALTGMGNPPRPLYVYRNQTWRVVLSTELVPGDIVSLVIHKPHYDKDSSKTKVVQDSGGDIVPADLLLLQGTTVVNEASLTGESVPQMKEGIDLASPAQLEIKTTHKMNIVYAGTKMLQCQDTTTSTLHWKHIPAPPDKGVLAFCLRTGFASAQGKLVRMIEGSQEDVKGHERETGLLLGLLCLFAIASSSYVLYHGITAQNRSKYELLLHCILIVTSVIRPELPMQMALAVNQSLMTLMRLHIFCTEPYRVPMAGKLDHCLFDKTGTLTTDELVAVGVCPVEALKTKEESLVPMTKLGGMAGLVIAGCHSLIHVDDDTTGDPLESAALQAIQWSVHEQGYVAPKPTTEKREGGKPIANTISKVEILMRHHFSSKLQRMSAVVEAGGSGSSTSFWSVAKGSPEAIGKLLANKPEGYDEKSRYLSKQGYRVIALACKRLESKDLVEQAKDQRAVCESELDACGFLAFTCRVRKDTADVLRRLKEGGMSISMVTGDALLTAIHVAKEVCICEPLQGAAGGISADPYRGETNPELIAFLDKKRGIKADGKKKPDVLNYRPILILSAGDKASDEMYWESYEQGNKVESFVASKVPQLARDYDLATTGKSLAAALEYDKDTSDVLGYFKVFARMTPDAKETVIDHLHSVGKLCLMCGDGANDVGALKQADVGVALLSGFGDLNVDKGEDNVVKKKQEDNSSAAVTATMSREHLDQIRALPVSVLKMKIRSIGVDPDKYPDIVEKEDLVKLYQIKARELAVKRHDKKNAVSQRKAKQKEDMMEKQLKLQQRTQELEAQGVQWASFKAMQEIWQEEMKKKKRTTGVEGSAASLVAQLEDVDTGQLPMIKLGDASIAAPFTSKMPSIRSCVDIVRQGRCTLVSSIQMYQILALQCLISSYSLSVLYLDGVKYGDTQMTAMGMLGTVSFMSVSRSKPLDKLSRVRPLTSIFHPALFISLLGQFVIHLTTMVLAVYFAKKHLPPDYDADLNGEFKPGILNTVVFLVSNVQQVTVFVVNLQGRPFMTGVTENRPLLWSLVATFILTFMFASESVPGLNKFFQLVPFPDEAFRDFILKLLGVDLVATFVLDRVMKYVFCRHILAASVEGTTWRDVFGLVRTVGVIFFLMYSFLGNDEQWEVMLAELEGLGDNITDEAENGTVAAVVNNVSEAVNATIQASVQAAIDPTLQEF